MEPIQNETIQNLFTDLGIDLQHNSSGLRALAAADSRFIKDLKLNVSTVLGSPNLTRKEAFLLALAVAVNERQEVLIRAFGQLAAGEDATEAEIAEIHACTALMVTNNVFYRFRHYMEGSEYYNNQPAGLRMSIMMSPVLGKEFFELASLVISAVNGCQRCVTSHEHSVKQHGATEPRIYQAIRLGAVIKSLCTVL
jgi:alkyl hydroperoxide reductase subunit D